MCWPSFCWLFRIGNCEFFVCGICCVCVQFFFFGSSILVVIESTVLSIWCTTTIEMVELVIWSGLPKCIYKRYKSYPPKYTEKLFQHCETIEHFLRVNREREKGQKTLKRFTCVFLYRSFVCISFMPCVWCGALHAIFVDTFKYCLQCVCWIREREESIPIRCRYEYCGLIVVRFEWWNKRHAHERDKLNLMK